MENWNGERQDVAEYNSTASEHLHRYAITLDFIKNKRVLDIASGEGYGSNIMAAVAVYVTGIDISQDAVNHAQKKYGNRNNLQYLQGSLRKIPIDKSSIDVVVSFESLEHDTEHDVIMQEIKRVLVPDGILIISTPDKYQYSDLVNYKNPFHLKELYKNEFENLVKKYFTYNKVFLQRFYCGSLIIPANADIVDFKMFRGDYNSVSSYNPGEEALYVISVSSDEELEYGSISFFNLTSQIEKVQQQNVERLLSSTSYRFGHFFVGKIAFLRDALKRLFKGVS